MDIEFIKINNPFVKWKINNFADLWFKIKLWES